MDLGTRLKAARAALKLKQEDVVTISGIPMSTYRKYEGGGSAPGADAIAGLIRTGINANWLLTGEGPMLLADLIPKPAPAARINVEALAQTLAAVLTTAPKGETQEQSARKTVQFYMQMVERGMLTPDGVGDGDLDVAA